MVGWHHRLNGHESEQTPGDSEGQASLVCHSPWGCKELGMTWRLNSMQINYSSGTISALILLCSHSGMSNSATPWTVAHQTSLSYTISGSLLKFMFIESIMLSNHLLKYNLRVKHPEMSPSDQAGVYGDSFAWH